MDAVVVVTVMRVLTMTMTKFIFKIKTFSEAYKRYIYVQLIKNNYSKNKQKDGRTVMLQIIIKYSRVYSLKNCCLCCMCVC